MVSASFKVDNTCDIHLLSFKEMSPVFHLLAEVGGSGVLQECGRVVFVLPTHFSQNR